MKKKVKPTIICVDDEKVILDSLKTQLKSAFGDAYSYEMAENAQDALELIEELEENESGCIVIVVSDWLMPGMKGDELLVKIHQKLPNVVKFMLTGQADDAAVERAVLQANLHVCLRKPWSEEDLIKSIRNAVTQLQ
jgi:CheY-like chemotaxis protein